MLKRLFSTLLTFSVTLLLVTGGFLFILYLSQPKILPEEYQTLSTISQGDMQSVTYLPITIKPILPGKECKSVPASEAESLT